MRGLLAMGALQDLPGVLSLELDGVSTMLAGGGDDHKQTRRLIQLFGARAVDKIFENLL